MLIRTVGVRGTPLKKSQYLPGWKGSRECAKYREKCVFFRVNLARVYMQQHLFYAYSVRFHAGVKRRVMFHALPVLIGLREIARNPAAMRLFAGLRVLARSCAKQRKYAKYRVFPRHTRFHANLSTRVLFH